MHKNRSSILNGKDKEAQRYSMGNLGSYFVRQIQMTRRDTVAGWSVSGNQWGAIISWLNRGMFVPRLLAEGKWSFFYFTQKWQQKNKQFHALLRTVIQPRTITPNVFLFTTCFLSAEHTLSFQQPTALKTKNKWTKCCVSSSSYVSVIMFWRGLSNQSHKTLVSLLE